MKILSQVLLNHHLKFNGGLNCLYHIWFRVGRVQMNHVLELKYARIMHKRNFRHLQADTILGKPESA